MSQLYTLVPRPQGSFKRLDCLSRYAFGLIYDRYQLSTRPGSGERFRDEKGYFCVFEREELAQEMGVSLPTVRRCLTSLRDAGVLDMRRAGSGAAWRYYVPVRIDLELGKLILSE